MRIFISLLFLSAFYQVSAQADKKLTLDDINKDGVIDTLKTFYSGGSGGGGRFVEIVNGKNQERHELTSYYWFSNIKNTIVLPLELIKLKNKLFLEIIKDELLPER